MDRRRFLKLAGAASLATMLPMGRSRSLAAATQRSGKPPILVTFTVNGGWDPTFMFAPKGKPVDANYSLADVQQIGNFTVAPSSPGLVDFVRKYQDKLLVINGIDSDTVDHTTGRRYLASGQSAPGYPHISALWAAASGALLDMPFAGNSGFADTQGMLPLAPLLSAGDLRPLVETASPKGPTSEWPWLRAQIDARSQRLQSRQTLLQYGMQHGQFADVRQHNARLDLLPTIIDDVIANVPAKQHNDPLDSLVVPTLAYCASGMTIGVHIFCSFLDTHANHDVDHPKALDEVFGCVDYLWEGAKYLGFDDRLIVLMVSDFGRTAAYNSALGKDHWPIGSAVVMGAGIPGNRVVGAIDNDLQTVKINAKTLRNDDQGVHLRPEHLHQAMRNFLGIAQHPLAQRFPFICEDVALFG